MPKLHAANAVPEELDRAIVLTLAATVLCPLTILRAIHAPYLLQSTQPNRITVLARAGLVERAYVNPMNPAMSRSGVLVLLSKKGWHMAGTLGASVLQPAVRLRAAALSNAVALVAGAYAAARTSGLIAAGGLWAVSPQGHALMPEGVWATFQNGQDFLAFDPDLPGRDMARVEDRLKNWQDFVAARQREWRVRVCYVGAQEKRREQVESLRIRHGWDWLQMDAPDAVLRAQFLGNPE